MADPREGRDYWESLVCSLKMQLEQARDDERRIEREIKYAEQILWQFERREGGSQ